MLQFSVIFVGIAYHGLALPLAEPDWTGGYRPAVMNKAFYGALDAESSPSDTDSWSTITYFHSVISFIRIPLSLDLASVFAETREQSGIGYDISCCFL